MQDTHLKWMLVVLVSLLILTGFLFFYPPAGQPTASTHPEFPSLLSSTGPYPAVSSLLGMFFGLLLIALMALTIIIGLFREGRKSSLKTWVLRCFAVYTTVWISIKFADDIYLESASPIYFGGFPLPTALLVFGMGIFPFMLIPFYYYYFSADIHNDEDQAKFDAMMEQAREGKGGEA